MLERVVTFEVKYKDIYSLLHCFQQQTVGNPPNVCRADCGMTLDHGKLLFLWVRNGQINFMIQLDTST